MQLITKEQRLNIQAREDAKTAYLKAKGKNWLGPNELEENGLLDVTNDERAQAELYDWHTDKPAQYFCYINVDKRIATVWTGAELGKIVRMGAEFRDSFGGVRVPVTIQGNNGVEYYGTYYKSSGDYCRLKAYKKRKAA